VGRTGITQPGVDFGHSSIYPFLPEKARLLSEAILLEDGLTYEAHSTDYQSTTALADLVKHHFFFLKVGPELTFRFREAVWALAAIEDQMELDRPSNIRDIILGQMNANPEYWQDYYSGTGQEVKTQKVFSYSDRIRYYWTDKKVAAALNALLQSLETQPFSETVTSQAFMGLEFGEMPSCPSSLVRQHIQRCVGRYYRAAGQVAPRHY